MNIEYFEKRWEEIKKSHEIDKRKLIQCRNKKGSILSVNLTNAHFPQRIEIVSSDKTCSMAEISLSVWRPGSNIKRITEEYIDIICYSILYSKNSLRHTVFHTTQEVGTFAEKVVSRALEKIKEHLEFDTTNIYVNPNSGNRLKLFVFKLKN